MKLVIVESPAKCSKIQGFLGSDYEVVASMGHIRALEESLDAVGLQNDFEPRFEFIAEKSKVQKQLKDAAKGKTTVYLAADDDREGEAIAYSVALLLKLPLATTPRIVFHEITKPAILSAVASPRTLNMNRIMAQQARSQLDMMIGFTLSPILWNQVARGLSAGRCQTPALKLIVEKEDQVAKFKATSSWKITGDWKAGTTILSASLQDDLEDEESATNYLDNKRAALKATVQTNTVRPWTSNPPDPLMTSTLQQQASALFGLSPKATMQIAQKLYEAGHITYMRTDKATLSEEAVKEAQAWITKEFGKEYINPDRGLKETTAVKEPKAKKDKKEPKEGEVQAQEAHEAIRPTHMDVATVEADYQRLYTLIRNRTLQSVMSAALGETCTVVFHCEEEDEESLLPWSTKWKRTTFPGWQRIGKVANLEEAEEEADSSAAAWTSALTLKPGTILTWAKIQAHPHETKASPRYTEATLVRELESHGIGRPSTFASLLAAVQDRGYAEIKDITGKEVEVKTYTLTAPESPLQTQIAKKKIGAEKKKLVPTDLGKSCLAFLQTHFPHLFDYRFTSQMEQRLDLIEKGTEPWKQVLKDTWASYKTKYETMLVSPAKAGTESTKIKVLHADGLRAVMSKKGPLLLIEGATKEDTKFFGWPSGVAFQDITEPVARAHMASAVAANTGEQIGTWKDKPVIKKVGKFGPYVQVGDINLSITTEDTWATIQAKLETKGEGGVLKATKEYEFKSGPYGLYMYKTALKKRIFVSVPKDTPLQHLSDAEAEALYKAGLDAKKKKFVKKI
jgi:DNA topoisomerase-1